MTKAPLLVLAGLLTVGLGLGGVAMLSSETAAANEDGLLPTCARSLGQDFSELQIRREPDQEPGPVYLFGIDRSPSNAEQANRQLDEAVQFAIDRPLSNGYGIFFVSDRSDRSSTPDFPLEPGQSTERAVADPLPCGEDCQTTSLFEHACVEKIEAALEGGVAKEAGAIEADQQRRRAERAARVAGWSADGREFWPEPGTSILRFWRKIADLPTVRRSPERVTVTLLSDLEEARTADRRVIETFRRARKRHPAVCPPDNPIPEELAGIEVVLLQTVTDRVNAQKWGETWGEMLQCAGVKVNRYRYSPQMRLAHYIGVTN